MAVGIQKVICGSKNTENLVKSMCFYQNLVKSTCFNMKISRVHVFLIFFH